MKKKGFTLIELLVVIAILAILATVSIIGYSSFIGRANESNCLTEATQIRELFIAEDINNDNMKFDNTDGSIKIEEYVIVDKTTIENNIQWNSHNKYFKKTVEGSNVNYTLYDTEPTDSEVYVKYGIDGVKEALKNDMKLSGTLSLDGNKFLKYTSKDGEYYAIIKFDNSEIKVQKNTTN